MSDNYPLSSSNPASLGFATRPLEHLDHLIRQHIEEGRYPGAQIALARHGKLALFRSYGDAKTEPTRAAASGETLFLLFSQTKVLTSSAVWAWSRRANCPSWTRSATICPTSPAGAKATSPCTR